MVCLCSHRRSSHPGPGEPASDASFLAAAAQLYGRRDSPHERQFEALGLPELVPQAPVEFAGIESAEEYVSCGGAPSEASFDGRDGLPAASFDPYQTSLDDQAPATAARFVALLPRLPGCLELLGLAEFLLDALISAGYPTR